MVLNCGMGTRVKAQMSQHLEEVMEDTDLYRWNRVRAYHAAWVNQLEQDRSSCNGTEHKLRLRRNLVWHAPMLNHTSPALSAAEAGKKATIPLKT